MNYYEEWNDIHSERYGIIFYSMKKKKVSSSLLTLVL